jgi:hypothetical protein
MLLTEVVHPQHRAPFTTIYNCLWNLGSFFCNAIGFGLSYYKSDWSWRILTLFQIIPALVQLVFVWGVPESPRWLISKDRHEEALQLLAKYHANGNEQDLTVQFEFREISETLKMEKHAAATTSYMDFFKTKGNRWRLAIIITIGVISQYSGNAVISNYANLIYESCGITSQTQKLGLTLGNTTLSLIVSITAALTVDKFGRRPLFLISAAGMTVCFVIWTALAGQFETHGGVESDSAKAYGIAQIPFIWIFGVFYAIGFSGLLVSYTLEVLPFFLRAKGVMIMNITVQAILALSAQTNPLAIHNLPHAWNFWLIYTVSLSSRDPHHSLLTLSRFGISSSLSGCTSSSRKPRASLSRSVPRSSMARMLWLTSAWSKPQRRSRSVTTRLPARSMFKLSLRTALPAVRSSCFRSRHALCAVASS